MNVLKNNKLYLVIILLIAVLPSLYFYTKYEKAQNIVNSLDKNTDETKLLIDKIGNLMVLPKNEVPIVATVSDKKKLINQPFFQIAENGDKVLIYSKSKKAILYRPGINKIIDVAPINLKDNPNATSSPTILPIP
ncbi:MAG: hypothetical protein WC741_03320 [Patescibacteria group bacterium]|jgi:hypothetical protein